MRLAFGRHLLDQRHPRALLRVAQARRVDAGDVREVRGVAGAGAGREGIGEDVEHHRRVLHPLHRRLERLVLQCHDHIRLGVERRVDQARQRGQVALGAGDGEHEVTARLQPGFLQAHLERVLAPLAPDPVGGADDGDRLRLGRPRRPFAVLSQQPSRRRPCRRRRARQRESGPTPPARAPEGTVNQTARTLEEPPEKTWHNHEALQCNTPCLPPPALRAYFASSFSNLGFALQRREGRIHVTRNCGVRSPPSFRISSR